MPLSAHARANTGQHMPAARLPTADPTRRPLIPHGQDASPGPPGLLSRCRRLCKSPQSTRTFPTLRGQKDSFGPSSVMLSWRHPSRGRLSLHVPARNRGNQQKPGLRPVCGSLDPAAGPASPSPPGSTGPHSPVNSGAEKLASARVHALHREQLATKPGATRSPAQAARAGPVLATVAQHGL